MPARAMGSAAISFGLVTVPVRIYPAVQSSAGISFHMLHKKDGVRLKQQFFCPKDEEVVPRSETVRGFEIAKDKYVIVTDQELKALDEKATNGIEIKEFVPQDSVDPVYFERTYYLGADKGGDKAYSLLADAMKDAGKAALAQYAARGKDYLVLLRSIGNRLMMQQLYHADEVRPIEEVPVPARKSSPAELKLAQQLIDQVSSERFEPEKYTDEVRKRIEQLIAAKAKGQKIEAPAARPKAEVVDLMEALKKSLGQGGRRAPVRAARHEEPAKKTARR
ncbi:MAG: Ku protein [Acidobacteria bacterium]|nr:MAG: Ku protein [Acidobacteriota bacterium]